MHNPPSSTSTMPRPRGRNLPRCWRKLQRACASRCTNREGQRVTDPWIILLPTREALAAFFHAGPPEHFIFTQNATDALNLLIHGFVKKTGMPFHAITTELDHNSVLRPLTALEQDGAITLSVVPFTDTTVSLAAIKKAICRRPGSS